jgi:hypothetical protein
VRRSSNAIDISCLEAPRGSRGASPEEWRGAGIPVGHADVQGLIHFSSAVADTPSQGALAQDFPEALAEIEPGSAFGQGNELKAGMPPVPEHGVHGPMQGQRLDNQRGVARWGERLQAIEETQPCRGVARRRGVQQDFTAAVLQRAKGPALALARRVGLEMRELRALGVVAPTGAEIALGGNRPQVIEADHRTAWWCSGGAPDDGPLFAATSGSSLSSQVRGFCHLICSALRMRRIWLRLMGTPCWARTGWARTGCSRSRVQWHGGGMGPSAGLGGSPRASAMTRL